MCIHCLGHYTSFLSRQLDVTASCVLCRHVFEVLSKFEENLNYICDFEPYFTLKFIHCVPYISWPLQD